MRLLVSAGGTGGGVYPALAVVAALGERADVLWVGGRGGVEASLVGRQGLAFESIPAAGVHGVGLRALPGNVLRLARGAFAASAILRRFRPDAALFTGGYVGVPVALAARGVPKLAFVPDIEPGLALKLITRLADVVAVSTEESRTYYPAGRSVKVTGYPVRPSVLAAARAEARSALGLAADAPVLLVMGGSLGARSINRAVWAALPELLARAQVLHVTGERDWPEVETVVGTLPPDRSGRYHAHPYLHEAMGPALASADLVVSRAGASSLGEYPAFGLPAILVPYPHAWRYQKVNARYLIERGAAIELLDQDLESGLLPAVFRLLDDPARLRGMGEAARKLARPGAAEAIAGELLHLVEGRARG